MPCLKKKVRAVLTALLIIFLGAILLEITVFNLRHWATRPAGPSANALDGRFAIDRQLPVRDIFTPPWAPLPGTEYIISGINMPIRTVFIRPRFQDQSIQTVNITIRFEDESGLGIHSVALYNGYEPSFYIPLGAMGDVGRLSIRFDGPGVAIQELHFNAALPWVFIWQRVVLLTTVLMLCWLWKKYRFSERGFNPGFGRHLLLDGGVVACFIVILFSVMFFATQFGFVPGQGRDFIYVSYEDRATDDDINALLTDALRMRQLHLDVEVHESLLNATQPYNILYRWTNDIEHPWDHVFFNGRFYSYFGIVPVIVLYLPYNIIRGTHITPAAATFIFAAIAAMGIYMLWKEFVRKYLRDIPYPIYLAGLLVALFGSNIITLVARPLKYEVAIAAGLAFSAWGLYFISLAVREDSYDKIKTKFLIFGGASMAMAVGSRPTMLFHSVIVLVLLIPTIRSSLPVKRMYSDAPTRKILVKNIVALASPYMVIGGLLAWYNFARFGSITEFGATFQLTQENVAVVTQTGILGNLRRAYDGISIFLFSPLTVRLQFPFVFTTIADTLFPGHMSRTSIIGVFFMPATWFLAAAFYLRKNKETKAIHVIIGMVATGLFMAVLSTVLIGALARYSVDFFWLFMLSAALCMGYVYKEACKIGGIATVLIRRVSYAAVGVTCVIFFAWGIVGERNQIAFQNPAVIRFLTDLFLIF